MFNMKKIIFCTNLPSPYRVDFFNEFGKYCDLTILYERHSSSERNDAWKGVKAINYKEIYLPLKLVGVDASRGSALKDYIKGHQSDILIFTNYASPTIIEAILWCRIHNRDYYIESDGGFFKEDPFFKGLLKKFLINGAIGHLTSSSEDIKYLKSIGVSNDKIFKYPFTSIKQSDIESYKQKALKGKDYYRNLLGMSEQKIVIAVGQFIHRKGFDVLIKAATHLDKDFGIYIIGGEPTNEYLQLLKSFQLENVHFSGFQTKDKLVNYYLAADCTAFPTREDIWGLITNESMAFGVPIVSTNKCISALEMIDNGINGYVVPVEDAEALASSIKLAINNCSSDACRSTAMDYTIETMVQKHIEYLKLD